MSQPNNLSEVHYQWEPYGNLSLRPATREEKISKPGIYEVKQAQSALDVQIAGNHYKGRAIQPVEYISANNLNFLEGCIVKRITRWRDKPANERFDDLYKIKHEIDLLIDMENKFNKV